MIDGVRTPSTLVCALLAALVAGSAMADVPRFPAPPRVVAFGDVHGAYDALTELLRQAGVVDAALDWAGGATHLVSLGDLLDRGPDSRRVLDLVMKLEGQAAAAGGRVHVVLGNHEIMNLTGDLRYVSAGEYAAFAADEGQAVEGQPRGYAAHRAAFSPEGRYGAWLRDKVTVVVIGDTAFVHGGLSALVAAEPGTIDARVRSILATAVGDGALAGEPLFGDTGPFWYRGNAQCHVLLGRSEIERALAALGARRVVIGHTPTASRRVESRHDGRVVLVDTGMLASEYGGRASAFVIEGGADAVIVAGEAGTSAPIPSAGPYAGDFSARDALAETLARGPIRAQAPVEGVRGAIDVELDAATGPVRARFLRMSKSDRDREVAAYRLDRLLGLGLVRVAVARDVDGRTGLLVEHPERFVTERERIELGRDRPNPCATGHDYLLLRAFDALVGNRSLDADELGYDRRTWEIGVRGYADAFGSHRIAVSEPPALPSALRAGLERLDTAGLRDALGLGRREIEALLERRDRIVAAWPVLE